jgi:hypothetical protein
MLQENRPTWKSDFGLYINELNLSNHKDQLAKFLNVQNHLKICFYLF